MTTATATVLSRGEIGGQAEGLARAGVQGGNVTLRRRALLVVGGGLVVGFGVILAVAILVVRGGFLKLEAQGVRADVERAVRAVAAAVAEVGKLAPDWATWDDTYRFVETGDPQWQRTTMTPSAPAAIRVGAVGRGRRRNPVPDASQRAGALPSPIWLGVRDVSVHDAVKDRSQAWQRPA